MTKQKKQVDQKTLNGKPATQKNVTLENDFFAEIKKTGKLDYMSFSSYVRSLIVNDLKQSQSA